MKLGYKFALLIFIFLGAMGLNIMSGAQWISPAEVGAALGGSDDQNTTHIIVNTLRLPRALLAVVVGASLAVAGALMQALTRNPLASPSLFGINAGAMFSIILLTSMFAFTSLQAWLWSAIPGAVVAATLVWWIGNRGQGKINPLRMVLAGASITAMFTAFSQAWLVIDQEGLDTVLFWLAGSLGERTLDECAPLMIASLFVILMAFGIAGQVNVLNAGDEIAVGLGQKTALLRLTMGGIILGLAACAVALAGSIGFIGLVIPHMMRKIISIDHRALLPSCALGGAILLLVADMIARMIILPQEVPVGVMTALFGAPFFIILMRRGGQHV